jgi:type IV secretory pathway VirB2 component (pilin)
MMKKAMGRRLKVLIGGVAAASYSLAARAQSDPFASLTSEAERWSVSAMPLAGKIAIICVIVGVIMWITGALRAHWFARPIIGALILVPAVAWLGTKFT